MKTRHNKIRENSKVTLTFGQLKKLVKESIMTEDYYEATDTYDGFRITKDGVVIYYSGEEDDIYIPDGVKAIDDEAFQSCWCKTVRIPSSVTKIGDRAFSSCEGLRKVTVEGQNLREIGEHAFYGCIELYRLVLPDTLISVGEDAFNKCESLTSIDGAEDFFSENPSALNGCPAQEDYI